MPRTSGTAYNGLGETVQPYWEFDGKRLEETSRRIVSGPRLTPQEHAVLLFLLQQQGDVARKEELMQLLWRGHSSANEHSLQTIVANLRRVLEKREYIETVPRVGYRWTVPAVRIVAPSTAPDETNLIFMSPQAKTADVYIHPNGSFHKEEGGIWKEHRNDAPNEPFTFKELRRDRDYIYLYDETRKIDPGRPLYFKLPIRGGVAQCTRPNPMQWEDCLMVEPQSPNKKPTKSLPGGSTAIRRRAA